MSLRKLLVRRFDSSQAGGIIPRCQSTNGVLDKTPGQLYRIEVRRVRRQIQQGTTRVMHDLLDPATAMNAGIVQNQNRTRQKTRQKVTPKKCFYVRSLHRADFASGDKHSFPVQSAQNRQVLTASGGNRFYKPLSSKTPAIQARHTQGEARFIQEHQLAGVYLLHLLLEVGPFFLVALAGDAALFFCENPSHRR